MKAQPRRTEPPETTAREQFVSLGSRVMAVSKEELDRREKAWQQSRKRKRRIAR